ncbi:MAG: hypothetical protein ACKVQU_13815 [Burkholderiales bacterium]
MRIALAGKNIPFERVRTDRRY